jgi:hypothetical protein
MAISFIHRSVVLGRDPQEQFASGLQVINRAAQLGLEDPLPKWIPYTVDELTVTFHWAAWASSQHGGDWGSKNKHPTNRNCQFLKAWAQTDRNFCHLLRVKNSKSTFKKRGIGSVEGCCVNFESVTK